MNAQEYIRSIATHYPDSDSIRRVLEFAQVDILNLDLEGKPLNTWFLALKEVLHQGKLDEFIKIISAEYAGFRIDESEKKELTKFLSHKEIHPIGEKRRFLERHGFDLFKLAIPLIVLAGYLFFQHGRKEKADNKIPDVMVADTLKPHVSPLIKLFYKNDTFKFPTSKSIFQLKQYILFEKEKLRDKNAASSKLMYLGKELANSELISTVSWTQDHHVSLLISNDIVPDRHDIDIFIYGYHMKDVLIFINASAGYLVESSPERTHIRIPKIIGNHNLEIYFNDFLSIVPVKIEYSTANISITKEQFDTGIKKVE